MNFASSRVSIPFNSAPNSKGNIILMEEKLNSLVEKSLLGDEAPVVPAQQEITRKQACLEILGGALPNLLYFTVGNLGYALNFYFIAQSKDPVMIDSVGLGNTIIETTTLAIIYSLNSGLCTLIAQAHGAKLDKLAGHYLHRGIMINLIAYCICSILWLFAKEILIKMNYDERVAGHTTTYLVYMIPAIFFSLIFDSLKNFVQAHKVLSVPMYIQGVCTMVEVGTSYLCIHNFDLGLKGLAFSRILSEFNKAWITFVYIKSSGQYKPSFFFFNKHSFQNIAKQAKFEIVAGSIMFLECMAYLISTMLAAHLEIIEFAGYLTSNQIINFLCMVPYALGTPLSSFISNAVGEKNIPKMRMYLQMGLILGTLASVSISMGVIFFAGDLAHILSDDPVIDDVAQHLLLIYSVNLLADTYQNLLGGVGRCIGKEKLSSLIFLLSYYLIGIPCCYIFGYVFDFRAYGIRGGIGVAQYLNTIIFTVMLCRTNFKEQVKIVEERLKKDEEDKKPKAILGEETVGSVASSEEAQKSTNTTNLL